MACDAGWYREGERRDGNLEGLFKDVTRHVVVQLPHAPPSEAVRALSADEARLRYPASDLWATMLRDSSGWTLEDVPAVFNEAPFAAVLEATKLSRYRDNAQFMADYREAAQQHELAAEQERAFTSERAMYTTALAAKDEELAAARAEIAALKATRS